MSTTGLVSRLSHLLADHLRLVLHCTHSAFWVSHGAAGLQEECSIDQSPPSRLVLRDVSIVFTRHVTVI